jgi:hypothetical protein
MKRKQACVFVLHTNLRCAKSSAEMGKNMNDKIRNHIEKLFENAPSTRKALELKEELLANSEERYQDLIANGVSTEDAVKNVINSIGNVSELFQGLEEVNPDNDQLYYDRMKKAAIIKTTAVGIYIFSIVVFIFCVFINDISYGAHGYWSGFNGGNMNYVMLGLILMILIDIVPTCMLVYVSSIYPKYNKREDTVVEDFKEWKSGSLKVKAIKGSVRTVIWTSTVLIYFAVSFFTFAWYATWIIFLVALCVQAVVELLFRLKELE